MSDDEPQPFARAEVVRHRPGDRLVVAAELLPARQDVADAGRKSRLIRRACVRAGHRIPRQTQQRRVRHFVEVAQLVEHDRRRLLDLFAFQLAQVGVRYAGRASH